LLRIRRPLLFVMLVVAVAPVGAALPPAPRAVAQTILTFPPIDDATIKKDQPTTNFGAASSLEVDNTPVMHFVLKFRVTGSGNAIQSAILRLRSVDPSGRGGDFFPATNGWEEETVTWQTAPGIQEATWPNASLGAVSVGNTYSADVTSYVLGDGTYSLRVSSPSSDGADYSSKEGSIRPVLVVTTAPDQIVMAAGDIACDPTNLAFNNGNGTASACAQNRTGALLSGRGRVLALGDTQYDDGDVNGTTNDEPDYPKYLSSYHPSWGRHKTKTHPAWGNHEYTENGINTSLVGYRRYFRWVLNFIGAAAGDPARGYYRVNLGAGWVGFALNTNCDDGVGFRHHDERVGCGVGSAQYVWLRDQLRALPAGTCELTWGHHPLWTSTMNSKDKSVLLRPLYRLMYDEGVELALVGHAHNYELFYPQNPYDDSRNDARGVRQVVVGTGGVNFFAFDASLLPNVVVRQNHTFGVARLTLRPGSYEGDFVPEASKTWDDPAWTGTCH
jgi:acid phosphatase type 7